MARIFLLFSLLLINMANAGYNDPPLPLRATGSRMLQSISARTSSNLTRQRTFYYAIEGGGGIITMIWPHPRILQAVAGQGMQMEAAAPNYARLRRQAGLGRLAIFPNDLLRRILRSGISQRDLQNLRSVSSEMKFQVDEARRTNERWSRMREQLRFFHYMRSHFVLDTIMRQHHYLLFYDTQHLGVTIFDPRLLRLGHDPVIAVIARCASTVSEASQILVHNQLIGCTENKIFYLIGERGQGTRSLFYVCRTEFVGYLQDPTVYAAQINVSAAVLVETPEEVLFLTVGSEPSFVIRKSDLVGGQVIRRNANIPRNTRQVLYANGYVWALGPEQENARTQLFALDARRMTQGLDPVVATYELENVGQMRVAGNYLHLRDSDSRNTRFFRMDPSRPFFLRPLPGVGEQNTTTIMDGDFVYFANRSLQRIAAVHLADMENLAINPLRGFIPAFGDLSRPCLAAGVSLLVSAREQGRLYIVDTLSLQEGLQAITVIELGLPLGDCVCAGDYFFVADERGEHLFAIDGRTHQVIADVFTTLPNTQPAIPVSSSRTNLIYAHGLLFLTNQADGTTKIFDLGGLENNPA